MIDTKNNRTKVYNEILQIRISEEEARLLESMRRNQSINVSAMVRQLIREKGREYDNKQNA